MKAVSVRSRTLLVVLSALTLAGGAAAVASNLGTRFNKPLVIRLPTSVGTAGYNWTSIPNVNPYHTFADLCRLTGLVSTGITRGHIDVFDPYTGVVTSAACGTTAATMATIPACICPRIINAGPGAPTSILIAGSHDPNVSCTIPPPGFGIVGSFWYSVPYTATARTIEDLCKQIGLAPPPALKPASLVYAPPDGGVYVTYVCGGLAAKNTLLTLGDCYRIREPNGPKTFVPQVY